MILYSNTYKDFKYDGSHLSLTETIQAKYESTFHRKANHREVQSWENSLSKMQLAMSNAKLSDDCGILIEYNLPNTSKRVDFIITGENEDRQKNVVIIELKQWQTAQATEMDGVVKTLLNNGIRDTSHPSYQAYGYKRFLNDFNEEFHSGNLNADSCAFLHNYEQDNPEPLLDDVYAFYVKDTPLFFKKDIDILADFLSTRVGNGKGMDILYSIENGRIKPSVKLIDAVGSLFRGNSYFTLIDEQKVLYEKLLHTPVSDEKQVVIINGGPGTGKSVLSFNLLHGMLKRNKNVILAAPNAAFRDVMVKKLMDAGLRRNSKKPGNRMVLNNIISGSASFLDVSENMYDVIIVDEAHRLKDDKAYQYRGDNQIEDIINASRYSIFFVDDTQAIRPEDIGSKDNIRAVAEQYNASVTYHELDVQFRCSGMQGYINWLDHTFHIKDTANYDDWDQDTFTVELCDSPHDVYSAIKEHDGNGLHSRMLAGYAWKWTSEKEGNDDGQVDDVIIPQHDFSMPWNSRKSRTTWAIDKQGIDQIGCIHTSQGLEFDYVGIIIGKDLQYDPESGKLFASWTDYKDNTGKKGLKNNQELLTQLVKQVYKVLLTRAMKGCYIYCQDDNLQEYLRTCLPKKSQVRYEFTEHDESYAAEI